jgi:hypothetical protein
MIIDETPTLLDLPAIDRATALEKEIDQVLDSTDPSIVPEERSYVTQIVQEQAQTQVSTSSDIIPLK